MTAHGPLHRPGTRKRIGLASALLLLTLLGCGYHLAGRGSIVIPDAVRVIAVLPFENRTNRPEIEQRVTESIADELSKRGRYDVVTDRSIADAVLEGSVTSYVTRPVQFGAAGRATRIEAEILLSATLRLREDDSLLWSQSGLLFKEQFDVPDTGEFFDQETIALDNIAKGAASAVITSIFEGF